jgi:hypothetical protein
LKTSSGNSKRSEPEKADRRRRRKKTTDPKQKHGGANGKSWKSDWPTWILVR